MKLAQSAANPCLFSKGEGLVCGLYVDDVLATGTDEELDWLVEQKNKICQIRHEIANSFLNATFHHCQSTHGIVMTQEDIIGKLWALFEPKVEVTQVYKTPAAPNIMMQKPVEGDPVLNEAYQALYRSGMGTILYLMQKCRPDLSNIGRDLSKCMMRAMDGDMKALK